MSPEEVFQRQSYPAARLFEQAFLALKQDIINGAHVPFTHTELCAASASGPSKKPRTGGKCPTCLGAISRSVAAYHKADSATEHNARVSIAANIGGHACTLSQMVHRRDHACEDFLWLLHEGVQNRAVNVALRSTIDKAFLDESCCQGFSDEERHRALEIMELCDDALKAKGALLRRTMNSLRADSSTSRL